MQGDFDDIKNIMGDLGADDIVAGINLDKPRAAPLKAPDPFSREAGFFEQCPKCGGSGRWRNSLKKCFACNGKGGRTFKTAPGVRAAARAGNAERKARGRAEWAAEHAAEIAWINTAANRNAERGGNFDFPAKMRDAIAQWGSLTDNQTNAVRRLMARDAERQGMRQVQNAERLAAAPVVDAGKLEAAFDHARAFALKKNPNARGVFIKPLKLRSGTKESGIDVIFSPGSVGSQWESQIFPRLADGKKLGTIKEGKFVARFECTAEEKAAVLECCNDPAKAATAFGQAWNVCSVCHAVLTNPESIARGIGPISAEKFGF